MFLSDRITFDRLLIPCAIFAPLPRLVMIAPENILVESAIELFIGMPHYLIEVYDGRKCEGCELMIMHVVCV